MRLYFKNIEIGNPHVRCRFTIGVLPEEMEGFKEFVSRYRERRDEGYDNIGEAIKKAEKQLAPYGDNDA